MWGNDRSNFSAVNGVTIFYINFVIENFQASKFHILKILNALPICDAVCSVDVAVIGIFNDQFTEVWYKMTVQIRN